MKKLFLSLTITALLTTTANATLHPFERGIRTVSSDQQEVKRDLQCHKITMHRRSFEIRVVPCIGASTK